MRILFLILVMLGLFGGDGFAAPTLVRSNKSIGSGISTVTLPSNNAGDVIIVAEETIATPTSPPVDTAGNTYVLIQNNTSASWSFRMYYVKSCVAFASTNTITVNDGSGFDRNVVLEYSGLSSPEPLRTSVKNSATSTSLTAGSSAMTTVSGDLVVGYFFANSANLTVGSGYVIEQAPDTQSAFEDKITAVTSDNPNMTGSSSVQWTGIGAAFIPATATSHIDIITGGSQITGGSLIN